MNKIAVVIAALLLTACDDYSVTYEKEWHSERNPELAQTLVDLNVENCGIYKYKVSVNSRGEYLLRCSKNGSAWMEYSVSTVLKNISAPRFPDPKQN